MCRWLVYQGPEIYLSTLLFKPRRSLVHQSRQAQMAPTTTNADGYGVGWYGLRPQPGVVRDVRPAWNDENLQQVATQVRSRLFFAHVRATTGTSIQRSNCHPFCYDCWLFQHNGAIEGYGRLRRRLDCAIDEALFPAMEGSTDSERMFLLALTFGLREDPPRALARMVGFVEEAAREEKIVHPVQMTVAVTNGECVWAVRYSSEGASRTLYVGDHVEALREIEDSVEERLPEDSVLILSEPLDDVGERWRPVPESTLLVVEKGEISTYDFVPES